MKTKIAVVLVIMFMFSIEGRAMDLNSNKENNSNLEENNFISEEKALKLAKQYIINEGIDVLNLNKMRLINKSDYHYNAIPKELFERDWIFIAPTTLKVKMFQGLKWGIIYVNKKTGKVIYGGEGPS
jgi:hypothetical protein